MGASGSASTLSLAEPMPQIATEPIMAPVAADRDQVEEWFWSHGVLLFSEKYALDDIAQVGVAVFVVVVVFELTILSGLKFGVLGSFGALCAFTFLLLPLIPLFCVFWGSLREVDCCTFVMRRLWRG